jgi:methylphosphotriester-DNA--protein-cysteine methyltransferase
MAMHFREVAPSPDLVQFVRSHWEFSVRQDAGGPFAHDVFPDGCVSISYGRNPAFPGARLSVLGPRVQVFTVPVWGGHCFRGVRLAPAAAAAVLGREPGTLRDFVPDLAEIAPELAASLIGPLGAVSTFEATAEVFETALRALDPRADRIDPVAAAAASMVIEAGGDVLISEVAAAVGLGQRQLERRFRAAVGLTPKEFARVRRLRVAARSLVTSEAATWADRAAEAGFADQAHMTRQFGSIAGASPKRFEKRVREIDHGDLVD